MLDKVDSWNLTTKVEIVKNDFVPKVTPINRGKTFQSWSKAALLPQNPKLLNQKDTFRDEKYQLAKMPKYNVYYCRLL